jgi:hypothetical protein
LNDDLLGDDCGVTLKSVDEVFASHINVQECDDATPEIDEKLEEEDMEIESDVADGKDNVESDVITSHDADADDMVSMFKKKTFFFVSNEKSKKKLQAAKPLQNSV